LKYVQVQLRGTPIAGLTAADFVLRDSNVQQQIQAIAIEDVPVTLLLALDTAGARSWHRPSRKSCRTSKADIS
jgi:hypothetical protein